MKNVILIGLLCFITGCSSNTNLRQDLRDVHPLEYSWQAMHIIDVLQTANSVAANPGCSEEGNPLTKFLIGKNPSKSDVYKWGVGSSILHFFLGKWVDKKFGGKPNYWNWAIRAVDNGEKFTAIHQNNVNGARIDGYSDERQAECDAFLEEQDPQQGNIINLKWKF